MIKRIVKILRKYLEDGAVDYFTPYSTYESMWEAIEYPPFSLLTIDTDPVPNGHWDILVGYPVEYDRLRLLARELISEIRGIEDTKLIEIPNIEEATKWVMNNMFFVGQLDEDDRKTNAVYTALQLMKWLNGVRALTHTMR